LPSLHTYLQKRGNVHIMTESELELKSPAPDFTLTDYRGETVRLAQFKGQKHVFLVFNRGFV
jgi:peroxiredoxin